MKYTICKYCNKEISKNNITKHIRSHVNGNYDKWQNIKHQTLDHDDLFCKYCKKEYKNKNSLLQHEIRCKENPNKIDTSNSFGQLNPKYRTAWNKGLTKETDDRVKNYANTFHKNYILGLHKDLSGDKNPAKKLEVKEKISKTCLEHSKNGNWHTSLAKHIHYNYKGNDLHGKWELYYAIYLDKNNIKWIRNKERFIYNYKNKNHYYTPDFYLINTNEYIEIKGYSTNKDFAKWTQFPKNKKLIVLQYKDLKNLGVFDCDITKYI